MGRNARVRDKRLSIVLNMPPLHRKAGADTEYVPEQDEVLAWMAKHPDVVNVFVGNLKDCGYIVFDRETWTWRGRDYEG